MKLGKELHVAREP